MFRPAAFTRPAIAGWVTVAAPVRVPALAAKRGPLAAGYWLAGERS